jgi:hypothetical protein
MATYTGEEVFQIAMELEETGEVLYEAMAEDAGAVRRIMDDERRHEQELLIARRNLH